MPKNKQTLKLQKRDWAIVLLFIIIIVTNFWWWSINTVRDGVEADMHIKDFRQEKINQKLKNCIDQAVDSCDINTPYNYSNSD